MKNLLKRAGEAVCLVSLAACSSTDDSPFLTDVTASGFMTPTAGPSAEIPVSLTDEQNGNVYNPLFGGAAFVSGTDSSRAQAYAGIIPGSQSGAVVGSGTVNYNTNYEVVGIRDVQMVNGVVTGQNISASGNLILVADFDGRTLVGDDGTIDVNGVISGQDLTGIVRYSNVNGELIGLIGQDAVVGAFAGDNSTTVFSGGFLGTP